MKQYSQNKVQEASVEASGANQARCELLGPCDLTHVVLHLKTCADLHVLDLLLKLVAQDCPLGVISVSLQ